MKEKGKRVHGNRLLNGEGEIRGAQRKFCPTLEEGGGAEGFKVMS